MTYCFTMNQEDMKTESAGCMWFSNLSRCYVCFQKYTPDEMPLNLSICTHCAEMLLFTLFSELCLHSWTEQMQKRVVTIVSVGEFSVCFTVVTVLLQYCCGHAELGERSSLTNKLTKGTIYMDVLCYTAIKNCMQLSLSTLLKKSFNWYEKSLSNDIHWKTHTEWILFFQCSSSSLKWLHY